MQYFKHFSDMRFGVKMRRLITKHGITGYGLYNAVLESIAYTMTRKNPMPECHEMAEDLADYYNMDIREVNEILALCVNLDLFQISEITEKLVSVHLFELLDDSTARSKVAKEMATKIQQMFTTEQITHNPENYGKIPNVTEKFPLELELEKEIEEELEEDQTKRRKTKKSSVLSRHKHGEYKHVLLTDEQHEKLLSEWGAPRLEFMITILDEGIELKGYKYKNHYLAIRNWEKKETRGPDKPTPEVVEVLTDARIAKIKLGNDFFGGRVMPTLIAPIIGISASEMDKKMRENRENVKFWEDLYVEIERNKSKQ